MFSRAFSLICHLCVCDAIQTLLIHLYMILVIDCAVLFLILCVLPASDFFLSQCEKKSRFLKYARFTRDEEWSVECLSLSTERRNNLWGQTFSNCCWCLLRRCLE